MEVKTDEQFVTDATLITDLHARFLPNRLRLQFSRRVVRVNAFPGSVRFQHVVVFFSAAAADVRATGFWRRRLRRSAPPPRPRRLRGAPPPHSPVSPSDSAAALRDRTSDRREETSIGWRDGVGGGVRNAGVSAVVTETRYLDETPRRLRRLTTPKKIVTDSP